MTPPGTIPPTYCPNAVMFATIFAILILVLAGWAIAKNYDAKVVLFAAGFLLMYAALIMGSDVLTGKDASGLAWADPFKAVKDLFIKQYANAGLIILTLFGFAAYMSKIGANDKVIELLSRPLAALTAAGVIATPATIVPTPLGGDNVVAARVLGFDHVVDYVFYHHAVISIPAIIVMGIVHYFWQKHLDRTEGAIKAAVDESELRQVNADAPAWYAVFPVLPLGLTIFFWAFFKHAKVGLVEITLFSFALAFIAETIRRRDVKAAMKDVSTFFNGMGDGFSKVVVLIVAASTMVAGLKAMGLIDAISGLVTGVENAGAGLMLVFSGITALITFVSGSGNAVFYSFIELIPQIADKAGIDPIMVALPMQLTSNVIRAASPVAAVVIIVAAVVKVNPLMVVKRTCVPLLSGFAAVLLLSLIRYA